MAEAGRPGVGASLGASDDMIGSLATRVRELALRVAQLEGELEAARRRIAVYEDFDATVQDSLSAALRAANQIRERAQVTAEALAQEARARRPASTEELEALRLERDVLRKAIDAAAARPPSRFEAAAAQPAIPMADMRSAATEALRGVFKELVEEIRATSAAAPVQPAQTFVQAPAAVPSRPDNSPSSFAAPTAAPMSAAQRPAATTPPPAPMTVPVAAPVAPPPVAQVAPRPMAPRPSLVEDEDVPADPRVALVAQPQTPAPAPAAAPAPVPAAVPEAVAAPRPAAPAEPVGEIQLVLSPIASFPRLVELERRLQGMPAVRTVYARDFRNGVATLAIGLRQPMTVQDFATAVTSLEYPRLRVLSTTGYVLELRIDSEASIA